MKLLGPCFTDTSIWHGNLQNFYPVSFTWNLLFLFVIFRPSQLRGVYDQIRNGAADSIDELVSAFEAVDSASPQYTTNFLIELLSRALDSNPRISSNIKRRALERLRTGSS